MKMHGITILDRNKAGNSLGFDLKDILSALGESVKNSLWIVSYAEALGEDAERLHVIADKQCEISGDELISIAKNIYQVVEGEFRARQIESEQEWLVIRAVDRR